MIAGRRLILDQAEQRDAPVNQRSQSQAALRQVDRIQLQRGLIKSGSKNGYLLGFSADLDP